MVPPHLVKIYGPVAPVKIAERRIDEGILRGERRFSLKMFCDLDRETMLELLNRYDKAGWNTGWETDHLTGEYIEFW